MHEDKQTQFLANREHLIEFGLVERCARGRAGDVTAFEAILADSTAQFLLRTCLTPTSRPFQVTLPRAQVLELLKDAEEMKEVEIDLESQKVIREDGTTYPFEIDPFRKNCLLHGLDDIGLTMQKMDSIRSFEAARSERYPWLDGATTRVPDDMLVPAAGGEVVAAR